MSLTVLLSLVLVGSISVWLNYSSTMGTLEHTMGEAAEIASERVEQELEVYKNIAYEVGSVARLANSETSVADKRSIIDQRAETHGFQRGTSWMPMVSVYSMATTILTAHIFSNPSKARRLSALR